MIRPSKPSARLQNYDRDLEDICAAVREILNGNEKNFSYEELYRKAYDLVLMDKDDRLFLQLKSILKNYVEEVCKEMVKVDDQSQFLETVSSVYDNYKRASNIISDVFLYLNRVRMEQDSGSISEVALEIFRDSIFVDFKNELISGVMELIHLDRTGKNPSQKLIASCTTMFQNMGVFTSNFQPILLEQTTTFYQNLGDQWVTECTVPEYLEKVYKVLAEELSRASIYLTPEVSEMIDSLMRQTLVVRHMNFILENERQGFINLLENDKMDDLYRMYYLMKDSRERIENLAARMGKYIVECGTAFVKSPQSLADPIGFIQGLLDMRKRLDTLLSVSFKDDALMTETADSSFREFADGTMQKRLAEYLSIFLDVHLKKNMTAEFDEALDRFITIFTYLQDKDAFESYYKIHLSKRLLVSRNPTTSEYELKIIKRLKDVCGASFVVKLEGMFNDMKLSRKSFEKFCEHPEYINTVKPLNIDFYVNVLTSCFWPSYTVCNAILPDPMMECTKAFRTYYKEVHEHRVLTWKKNLGDGVMVARYPLSKHELIVTTYQMIILMVFNDVNEITFGDLAKVTAIAPKDLEKNLILLFLGKYKLLTKEPKTRTFSSTDILKWNAHFKSSDLSIKMNGRISKEVKEEKETEQAESAPQEESKHTTLILKYIRENKRVAYKDVFTHVSKSGDAITAYDFKKEIERLLQLNRISRSEEDRRILIWNE